MELWETSIFYFSKIFFTRGNNSSVSCRGIDREEFASVSGCVFSFLWIPLVHSRIRSTEYPDTRDTKQDGYAMTAHRKVCAKEKEA